MVEKVYYTYPDFL